MVQAGAPVVSNPGSTRSRPCCTWYQGREQGNDALDVFRGAVNLSGRLLVTFLGHFQDCLPSLPIIPRGANAVALRGRFVRRGTNGGTWLVRSRIFQINSVVMSYRAFGHTSETISTPYWPEPPCSPFRSGYRPLKAARCQPGRGTIVMAFARQNTPRVLRGAPNRYMVVANRPL